MKFIIIILFVLVTSHSMAQTWQSQGPAPINNSFGKVSGRIWTMAVSPAHYRKKFVVSASLLIGTDGGGIFKSSNFEGNANPTWEPVTDNLLPDAKHISCITVSPNDPELVYAGNTGGQLFQSTDGGNTWSEFIAQGDQSTGFATFESEVTNIVINPVNNDLYIGMLYIGVIKKSGSYFVPMGTGLPPSCIYNSFDMITSANGDPTLLVSSSYIPATSNRIWSLAPGATVWQEEKPALWDIKSGVIDDPSVVTSFYIRADHRPGSPNGAYCAAAKGGQLLNLFQYKNSSWGHVGEAINNCQDFNAASGLATSSRFWALAVSPDGDLYFGIGHPQYSPIYQSLDEAAAFASIETQASASFVPHVDPHWFAFYAGNVYCGNDGGVYRFIPLPGRATGRNIWQPLNTPSLSTILSQGVAIDPADPTVMLTGSQDNGVSGLQGGSWTLRQGGDNGRVLFDQSTTPGQTYAYFTGVSNFPYFFRSADLGNTWTDITPADAVAKRANTGDYGPFAIHPADPSRIVLGTDRIYESRNRGTDYGNGPISPVFDPHTDPTLNQTCGAIAYESGDIIWAAYGSTIYKTTNDGGDGSAANWIKMNGMTDFGSQIISIVPDRNRAGNIYIATTYGAWFTSNDGLTWQALAFGLPNGRLLSLNIVQPPDNPYAYPAVFAGTFAGVYTLTSRLASAWSAFNEGLPLVEVPDLQYLGSANTLAAATYGRGVFTIQPSLGCLQHISISHITG